MKPKKSSASASEKPAPPPGERPAVEPLMAFVDIAIQGERPGQHARKIQSALGHAAGVHEVEPHVAEAYVHVTYDARVTDPAAMHDSLLAAGYKAARKTK